MLQKKTEKHNSSFQSLIDSVISHEHQSLGDLLENQPHNTVAIIDAVHHCRGRIVFTGMGKSGLVCRLLAATFSSVGIPSFFIHPTESLHGDIGTISSSDLCIVLSKSGNGIELAALMKLLAQQGNRSMLWSCRNGALIEHATEHVLLPLVREAGPFDLVPTSSTLVMLSFGHAIALAVAQLRDFSPEKFLKNHPAGSIGEQLRSSLGLK